jgi:hypothetical protein
MGSRSRLRIKTANPAAARKPAGGRSHAPLIGEKQLRFPLAWMIDFSRSLIQAVEGRYGDFFQLLQR